MADFNYSDIKVETNFEFKTFNWCGNEIEVIPFLSTNDKYDIVMITLQQSKEDGYYNPIKLDMFFHLNLLYNYLNNVTFSIEEREDPCGLYDSVKKSGFLNAFLSIVNGDEYSEMLSYIEEIKDIHQQYMRSVSSVANKLIDDLPANAKAALDIVNNFDEEKFAAVKQFAEAANGGRSIAPKVE